MTQALYIVLALVAGAVLSPQALINARLASHVGGGIWAGAVSFIVGACGLLALLAVLRAPLPSAAALGAVPFWAWLGGLLGAVYIAGIITAVPHLGAATTIALIVFGQMLASIVLDHFGLLQPAPHPLSYGRAAGAVLLVVGVLLITRS